MADYRFAGVNVWTYSDNRAIAWFGNGHYSDKKRHLTYERGSGKALGFEVTVGGEEGEIRLRLGLLFATFYIGVTGLVRSNRKRIDEVIEYNEKIRGRKVYAFELDFADGGRRTGLMASYFDQNLVLTASLWENNASWSRRPIREKFRFWPYCEGASWSWYSFQTFKWNTVSKVKTEPETYAYVYTLKSGEVQHRTATVVATTEQQKRWWWFPRKRTLRSIWVKFDRQIGEDVGTWKGGVCGCGYDMNPGETPLECLRRMESEKVL